MKLVSRVSQRQGIRLESTIFVLKLIMASDLYRVLEFSVSPFPEEEEIISAGHFWGTTCIDHIVVFPISLPALPLFSIATAMEQPDYPKASPTTQTNKQCQPL